MKSGCNRVDCIFHANDTRWGITCTYILKTGTPRHCELDKLCDKFSTQESDIIVHDWNDYWKYINKIDNYDDFYGQFN